MGGVVEDINKFGANGLIGMLDEDVGQAITYAALAAAAVYTGGAALGAAGALGAGGATAASVGSAAHAAGMAAATSGAGMAAMAGTGINAGMQSRQTRKQEAAQEEARQRAEAAERDANIIRKRALLAEQTSTQGRTQAARTVRNNLQGLSRNSTLGGASERLGG